MSTTDEVRLSFAGNITEGATAAAQAMERAAAAIEKATELAQTQDQTIQRVGRSHDTAARSISGETLELAKANQAQQLYQANVQTTNQALARGQISQAQATEEIRRYGVALDAALAKAKAQGDALESRFIPQNAQLAASTKSVQYAMRDLGLQSIDLFQGLATGQPIFRTLIQQGGQVAQVNMESGVSFKQLAVGVASAAAAFVPFIVIGAVAAGIVAMGAASEQSARQMLGLQNSLRATRDDYVSLATEVTAAAKAVAATTGIGTSDALSAGKTIAASPNFTGGQAQLEQLIKTSDDLAIVWGKTVPDAAKTLSDALKDPGAVAKQLATDHFPGMTFALANSIERMAAAGDSAGAFSRVLGVLGNGAAGASNNLTPLQTAMQHLDEQFTAGGQKGRSFADQIGTAFDDAAASAIEAVSRTIKAIRDLQTFTNNLAGTTPAGPVGNANNSPLYQGQSFLGQWYQSQTTGPVKAYPPPVFGPDAVISAAGVNDALRQSQAGITQHNNTIGVALADIAGSPQGSIDTLTDKLKALRAEQAAMGQRTTANAADFDTLSTAIKVDQKALADAQKQLEGHEDAIVKDTNALKAQIDGQQKLLDATLQGPAAVAAVTAAMKANETAISAGLVPGTTKYAAAVADLTAKNLDLAKAQGAVKLAGDIQSTKDQISILQAETGAIGQSNDERELMVAHMTAEQKVRDSLVPLTAKEAQTYLDSVDSLTRLRQAYDNQKQALSDLASMFSSAFDQISQAVTNSLLAGTGAAISWRNVMTSVAQQVLSKFLELAVLNPLLNNLFGQSNTTLATALAAVSNLSASQAAAANDNATGSGRSAASSSGTLLSGGSLLSNLGLSNFGESLGLTGPNGLFTGASSFLSAPLMNAAAFNASTPLGNALLAQVGVAPGAAPLTLGGIAGGFGAGFGVGSLAGGFLQSSLGKTGPAPEIGAGIGAAAGVAGAALAPGTFGASLLLAGLIGGLGGGLGGGLIGPPKASAYSSTGVSLQNGQLGIGNTYSQLVDASNERAAAQAQADTINSYLTSAGLTLTSIGAITQVGQNTPGGFVDPSKFADISSAFSSFRFSAANDNVNGLISGQSFSDVGQLQSVVGALQQFVSDVGNSPAAAQIPQFLATLSGVATSDLPTQLQAIDTFVTQTVPALEQVGQATGSWQQAIGQVQAQYAPAIAMAQQLGYAEADLTAARDKATSAVTAAMEAQVTAENQTLQGRYMTAQAAISGSPQDALGAQLFNFDVQAQSQRDQLISEYKGIFGDTYAVSAEYAQNSAQLEKTLGEERLSIQTQYNNQITASAQQAAQSATSVVTSLSDYVQKLMVGSNSPLSPQDQYSAASNQFNAVAGAAAAGDANSITSITSFADTLLSASRTVNGSGVGYANDVNRIVSAISNVVNMGPDALTNSFLGMQMQMQTQTLVDSQAEAISVLRAILSAINSSAMAPARAFG